jgi:ribosomal protein S1
MAEDKEKELEGTTLRKGAGGSEDFEVESLIKETLEESKKLEVEKKEEEKPEAVLKATPITKKAEEPKPEQPAQKKGFQGYEATFKQYKVGDIVSGKVVKIDPAGVLVDIGYKAEGLIRPDELSEKPGSAADTVSVGEEINVYIENLENKEGYVVLSKKRADYEGRWRTAYRAYKKREVLEAKVTSAVKGGLVVDCGGIRGFIPASQVAKKAEDKLEGFVGKTIPIKILNIDRRQGKVVLSHKLAAGEKHKFETDKILNELEIGQVRKGAVTSLKSFGAFVDIGGIEGLIHLTELSWKRVNHPSEMLKIGDEIDVFVLGVDKESRKVALGLKQLQPDPWVEAENLYKVGQMLKGKVTRIVKFGAFIELEKGLEGLCHISEISAKPVQRPEDALKVGDEVTVKILRILPDEQKIGLSIRDASADIEKEKVKKAEEEKNKVTIEDVLKEKNDQK